MSRLPGMPPLRQLTEEEEEEEEEIVQQYLEEELAKEKRLEEESRRKPAPLGEYVRRLTARPRPPPRKKLPRKALVPMELKEPPAPIPALKRELPARIFKAPAEKEELRKKFASLLEKQKMELLNYIDVLEPGKKLSQLSLETIELALEEAAEIEARTAEIKVPRLRPKKRKKPAEIEAPTVREIKVPRLRPKKPEKYQELTREEQLEMHAELKGRMEKKIEELQARLKRTRGREPIPREAVEEAERIREQYSLDPEVIRRQLREAEEAEEEEEEEEDDSEIVGIEELRIEKLEPEEEEEEEEESETVSRIEELRFEELERREEPEEEEEMDEKARRRRFLLLFSKLRKEGKAQEISAYIESLGANVNVNDEQIRHIIRKFDLEI